MKARHKRKATDKVRRKESSVVSVVTNTISVHHLSRALGCGKEYRKHFRDFLPFKEPLSPLSTPTSHSVHLLEALEVWGVATDPR